MGEVYRARDDRLERDVAIKVLPASFTLDAERRERFEREARVLAALNHPSIAAIYGYEEAEGIQALVLELVEGPTLAERRTAGPVLLQDALTIARQIAEALEAAHARGIVHRDIKPANIKVSPDGRVKVLDFGLAKTLDEDGAAASPEAATQLSGPSQRGMILGTAPYMSPEQARGRPIDQRTDIWAFGCVLYEMLTGQLAFSGLTMSDAMVAVLEREPDWNALPKTVPDQIRQLLRRCLQKDQQQRLRDIGDARLELAEALAQTPSARAGVARPRRRSVALAAIAAALLVAVVGWVGVQKLHVASSAGARRLSDGNRASSNADANAYYERALLFGGVGTANPEQAERMLEQALTIDPAFAAARAETAFFQVARILNGRANDAGLFYQAESKARQALEADPHCGRAHSVLALVFLLQGRKELAMAELKQALDENPRDPTAHGWLSITIGSTAITSERGRKQTRCCASGRFSGPRTWTSASSSVSRATCRVPFRSRAECSSRIRRTSTRLPRSPARISKQPTSRRPV